MEGTTTSSTSVVADLPGSRCGKALPIGGDAAERAKEGFSAARARRVAGEKLKPERCARRAGQPTCQGDAAGNGDGRSETRCRLGMVGGTDEDASGAVVRNRVGSEGVAASAPSHGGSDRGSTR